MQSKRRGVYEIGKGGKGIERRIREDRKRQKVAGVRRE